MVRAQQLSLQDAAVASYVKLPPPDRRQYERASWVLECELVYQIRHLNYREFWDREQEFHSLKREEVWQAGSYHHLMEELYERLRERENRLEGVVTYWNERLQEVNQGIEGLLEEARRVLSGSARH